MRLKGDFLFIAGFVVAVVLLLMMTLGYNPQARLAPLVVLVGTLALAGIQLGSEVRRVLVAHPRDGLEADNSAQGEEGEEKGGRVWNPRQREARAILWVIGFFGLILVVGFYIAIPLFAFVFQRVYGRESWTKSALLAGAFLVVVYLVFGLFLKASLYSGLLFRG